ncbi:hypothetical protein O0880_10695 [Janthinobacterium sp. SUN118]|nr:hypothetical protein [Janthinobacterium sp. SUN118]
MAINSELLDLYPDEKIRRDFFAYARSEFSVCGNNINFIVDGLEQKIPIDCELTVIARVAQVNYFPVYTETRIVVAVGGVVSEKCGVVTPGYFFAKLYYNEQLSLFSVDLDF